MSIRPDNPAPDTGQPWLTALEAAASVGVNERTIRRAIARGTLPATKRSGIWRIAAGDLAAFAPGHRRQAARPQHFKPAISLLPARPPFRAPLPRTTVIGREQEVGNLVDRLLDPECALITLTGPGGSGKTRLALAVAAEVRDRFADGIWFVDLSPVRDWHLVLATIAQAIGLREAPGLPGQHRLGQFLEHREVLLILDNLEQVVPAGNDLASVVTSCPHLTILATSRVPLQVSMEQRFPVPTLTVPDRERDLTVDRIGLSPAIELFCHKAQAVQPGFSLTAANAPAVAEICRRLDGLPLAIELAAAQTAVYAPAALLERLDTQLAVLEHGPQDAPPRLRSMRDAIGWSHDLLDAPLQQRFRRLCVFDGGFTADAAAVVTSQSPLDPASCDAHLQALVDANLVVANPETSRFTLLETIREFGQEQLEIEGEMKSMRDAHARWCLELLTRAHLHWFTPTQTHWGDLIEQEHANLRAALAWLDDDNRQAGLIALVGSMWPFWFVRTHWREGMAWLERGLDASAGQHSLERTRVLNGACCLWLMRGDEPAARAFGEEAMALYNELGLESPFDNPLTGLAICANSRGDFDEGRRLNLEALAMLRAHAGSVPLALPIASVILCNMAWTLFSQGRVDEADPLAREALQMQRDLGFDWAAADTLLLHANIAEARGQHERATACYHESLRLAVETRDLHVTVANLDRCARFLAAIGDDNRVAMLLSASARLHEIVADVPSDDFRTELAHIASRARAHLGDDGFDKLYRHGQAMSLEESMAVALEATVPPSRLVSGSAARWGITRRELEVLGLVAQGLTDQDIADTLFVGLRTVHTHVSRLLDKLGAANRREVIARARAEHILLDDPSLPAALS